MNFDIVVEDEAWKAIPGLDMLVRDTAGAALRSRMVDGTVSLLLTSDSRIADINRQWRGKPLPTNVLSFPAPTIPLTPPGEPRFLGDLALAFGVISREAAQQGKPLSNHLRHLIVHGVLHLLGSDHQNEMEAMEMEAAEVAILNGLGVENPYE